MKNLLLALTLLTPAAFASEGAAHATQSWSFEGAQGHWNKDQLYRGYTVATQVCMNCHSFKYISHRDLMRAGFTEAEVTAMAESMKMDLNAKLISGLDEQTAKDTYGKVPPDLSVMNKARHGGANYVHALLNGYSEDPEEIAKAFPNSKVPDGAYFNSAFPGNAIAMPNPLNAPDLVTYHDGTKASVEQMSTDVATFMQWTAEPELIERKRLGVYVLIYLAIFTVLAYFTKRAIWKDIH